MNKEIQLISKVKELLETEYQLRQNRLKLEKELKQIWLKNSIKCQPHKKTATCLFCAKREDQNWMLKNKLRSEVYLEGGEKR